MSGTPRVLVTGATGFVGRQTLAPLQALGFDVHMLDYGPPVEIPPGVIAHSANLLEAAGRAAVIDAVRPTHLLHLAWYVEHGKFWEADENLAWTAASFDLLRRFTAAGGQRAVFAGTCAEYDWSAPPLRERTTPLRPATLYGFCKRLLFETAADWAERNRCSLAWGRVFFLYGPHEPPVRLVPSVIGALLRGEPALCSIGTQVRDFLHVADVAGAFAALLKSPVTGPVNIAGGQPTTIAEMVRILGEECGQPGLVRLGALPLAANDPPDLTADATRLLSEVGYRPRFGLRSGLRDTVQWWRGQLAGASPAPLSR
jgi:nucleoside-diphosphate-sugar epimerase